MRLRLVKKRVNNLLFLILFACILLICGCVQQPSPAGNESAKGAGLQIVLKDFGLPEVRYLQPTITEIQLKDQSGDWVTIWSSAEGKTFKLTSDGAELLLDKVEVKAGTYTETRILVTSMDVELDINRDGDAIDKNVQIIMTEEEFATLPHGEKPSAPSQPSAPERPSAPEASQKPEAPQAPSKPEKPEMPEGAEPGEKPEKPEAPPEPEAPVQEEPERPSAPSQPSQPSGSRLPPGVEKIEGGFVYMDKYLDEVHTATPPYFDGIHNETYLYPVLKTDFVYDGSGGKIVYDFTLHPLLPKHEQISLDFYVEDLPEPSVITVSTLTLSPASVLSSESSVGTVTLNGPAPVGGQIV